MDQDQWYDYRESVLRQVTHKLAECQTIAEAMGEDIFEASFEGRFTIDGGGRFQTSVKVGGVPLWIEDEQETDVA